MSHLSSPEHVFLTMNYSMTCNALLWYWKCKDSMLWHILTACSPLLRKQSVWPGVWTDAQLSSLARLDWHWLSALYSCNLHRITVLLDPKVLKKKINTMSICDYKKFHMQQTTEDTNVNMKRRHGTVQQNFKDMSGSLIWLGSFPHSGIQQVC